MAERFYFSWCGMTMKFNLQVQICIWYHQKIEREERTPKAATSTTTSRALVNTRTYYTSTNSSTNVFGTIIYQNLEIEYCYIKIL